MKPEERGIIENGEKIVKKLSKIFKRQDFPISYEELDKVESISAIDESHVIYVISKDTIGKELLREFYDKTKQPKEPTALLENKTEGNSMFNVFKVKHILDILALMSNEKKLYDINIPVRIRLGNESPVIIENKHLRFYLAPRIESE